MTRGQHLRTQLAARDGLACCYCGRLTVEKRGEDDDRATIEHVIPQSRGGTDSLDNLRFACRRNVYVLSCQKRRCLSAT